MSEARPEKIAAGQIVEVVSRHADYGGLYPVRVRPNKVKVYLAELDGCTARVLYPATNGLAVVDVRSEATGRAGKTTLPAECLKPIKAAK